MAGYFMYSLDWDAWEGFLAPPATELTGHLMKTFKRVKDRWRISTFPEDNAAYEEALAAFLTSDNWYPDLDYEDSHRVESLLHTILNLSFRKKIKLHYFPMLGKEFEMYESVYWDCIDVLWSGTVLPEKNKKKSVLNWYDFDRSARRTIGGIYAGGDGVPEFGLRPFRHPDFDLEAMAKAHGDYDNPVYVPSYGLHPPEDVAKMLDLVEEAAPRLEKLDEDSRLEYEFLRATLAKTVEKQGGLFVQVDT